MSHLVSIPGESLGLALGYCSSFYRLSLIFLLVQCSSPERSSTSSHMMLWCVLETWAAKAFICHLLPIYHLAFSLIVISWLYSRHFFHSSWWRSKDQNVLVQYCEVHNNCVLSAQERITDSTVILKPLWFVSNGILPCPHSTLQTSFLENAFYLQWVHAKMDLATAKGQFGDTGAQWGEGWSGGHCSSYL